MEKKKRFGLVGCGRISKRHILSIKRDPNAELVAICDINNEKLRRTQKEHNIKKGYIKFQDLINNNSIDVINICTPSGMHPKMVSESIKKGKHVVCEKPLSLNYQKGKKAVDVAKKEKKHLFVCFQNRYNKPIVYLKNVLKKGGLGKILAITATVRWYRDDSYYSDWHGKEKIGGGILFNQAIHYVDMLLYLMNKKPISVFCERKTLAHNIEIDDIAIATIIFSDNTIGLVEATTLSYPKNMEGSITLQCERGTVKIGGEALNEIEYWEGNTKPNKKIGSKIENIYGESHSEVINNVVNVLLNKDKPFCTGGESLNAIRVIEKAYESSIKGKKLSLK